MRLRGTRTTYGEIVGILMLDTRFPRPPGDIGHADTFPFPVRYRTVEGASTDRVMDHTPDADLLGPFVAAARELQEDGVAAITTSCGFLGPFQAELSAAVDVPVFASSLLQAPWIRSVLGPGRSIGVFTERAERLNDSHFRGVGWSAGDLDVHVQGMAPGSVFPATFIDGRDHLDTDVLRSEMESMTTEFLDAHPEAGAILFECTNMCPFASFVSDLSGLPVFDLNTLIAWIHRSLRPARFLR